MNNIHFIKTGLRTTGLFMFLLMLSAWISPAQAQDTDLFDPIDNYGDPWFEYKSDRADFFNKVVAVADTADVGGRPVSFRHDIFAAVIRTDADTVYDNKSYHSLVLFGHDSPVDLEVVEHVTDIYNGERHLYDMMFFIGDNLDSAKFEMDGFQPGGEWGSEDVEDWWDYTLIVSDPDETALREEWLETNEYGIIDSLKIIAR